MCQQRAGYTQFHGVAHVRPSHEIIRHACHGGYDGRAQSAATFSLKGDSTELSVHFLQYVVETRRVGEAALPVKAEVHLNSRIVAECCQPGVCTLTKSIGRITPERSQDLVL